MDTPNSSKDQKKSVNPFLKVIMILVAIPAMGIWESAKYLCRKAYDETSTGLSYVFGVLAALAGGIGTGYYMGWVRNDGLAWWLGLGVLAAVLSFVYVWPVIYLGGFKKAIRLSEYLWENVDSSRRSESWVTGFLMGIGRLANILLGIGVGLYCITHAHAFLATHGWDGWFLNALGWVGSVFFGGLIGLAAGALSWGALSLGRIPLIAAITGGALTYAFSDATSGAIAARGWNHYFAYGAEALEFGLWMGYIFPVLHILLSKLDDVFEFLFEVYDEKDARYRGFFTQVVNIAGSYSLTKASFLLWSYIGLTNHWGVLGAAAAVALLSYTLLGKLFRSEPGLFIIGIITGLHSLVFVGLAYHAHAFVGGWVGAVIAGLLAGVVTVAIAFPIAYVIVKFITNFLIASWASALLVGLHDGVCKLFRNLGREIWEANDNTYGDRTPYRELFLHVANLGIAYAAYVGSVAACSALSFALWLTVPTIALAVFLSYALVGKLLLKAGNHLVGVAAGLGGAVFVGTWAYAAQPYGLYVAIPVGLIAGALTYGFAFPVAYVLVRAIVNVVKPEKWAQPFLSYVHTKLWVGIASFWAEFLETYRAVRTWFTPTWATIMANWQSAKQTVKDTWESVTKKK